MKSAGRKKDGNRTAAAVLLALACLAAITFAIIATTRHENVPVRIGYFHGGRTFLFYRAYTNGYFNGSGLNVTLVTRSQGGGAFEDVPLRFADVKNKTYYGMVTGTDLLVEGLSKGEFDGATIGETAFVLAASGGAPIVAVAALGHDTVESPGHAVIFRSGVHVNSSADIRGKTLAVRSSSGGDLVFLDEFLLSEGLDPEKDVRIAGEFNEGILAAMLKNGSIDGGYFHLMEIRNQVEAGNAYVYRRLDWVDPANSQGLLVFRKDFVRQHPDEVQGIVTEYSRRIIYENGLPMQERTRRPGPSEDIALEMATDFHGMNLPQCDYPPLVNRTLLYSWRDILVKDGVLGDKNELDSHVDNSFVLEASRQLGAK